MTNGRMHKEKYLSWSLVIGHCVIPPCPLPQPHQLAVALGDMRDKVESQVGVLGLQLQTAEAEQVLHGAVLHFLDFLQDRQVDALVLVGKEEGFLDAVHAPVGDDDEVEEEPVEADEELELDDEEEDEERE